MSVMSVMINSETNGGRMIGRLGYLILVIFYC